jgi:hypothetical protein
LAWHWNNGLYGFIKVRFDIVPILSWLGTHFLLPAEYAEALYFKHLITTFIISSGGAISSSSKSVFDINAYNTLSDALSRLLHVMVCIDISLSWANAGTPTVQDILK